MGVFMVEDQSSSATLAQGQLLAIAGTDGIELFGNARDGEIVPRMRQRAASGGECTLVVAGVDAADLWVTDLSVLEKRLLRRCWPGPLTLQLDESRAAVLATRLPETLGELTQSLPLVGLRLPSHPELLRVLQRLDTPLVNLSLPSGTIEKNDLQLPAPIERDTVVRVENEKWSIVRSGELSTEQLQLQSICVILFICTGNTCRSPLAEALCKKRLAARLGCSPAELVDRGYLVLSSGLAAMRGDPAAQPAIEVAAELGASLEQHASQPLDARLAMQADYIVCMTNGHLQLLQSGLGSFADGARLLREDGRDIADPIGQDLEVYRACAKEMDEQLEHFLQSV